MLIYGWELTPINDKPLREDMVDALNEIINHNSNSDILIVITYTGGPDLNLIGHTVVYGYHKDYDVLHDEIDRYIHDKFTFNDLSEDFWGPYSDLGSDYGKLMLNKEHLCFYKGNLYKGKLISVTEDA